MYKSCGVTFVTAAVSPGLVDLPQPLITERNLAGRALNLKSE
jgi:hypothetical protein